MELRHLQFFIAVAEELSFTRASRRLHVVQSGVSSAIQGLERELGAALFDRDRHRVALTGKSFSRHANTVRGDTAKIAVSPGMAATRIPYLLLKASSKAASSGASMT